MAVQYVCEIPNEFQPNFFSLPIGLRDIILPPAKRKAKDVIKDRSLLDKNNAAAHLFKVLGDGRVVSRLSAEQRDHPFPPITNRGGTEAGMDFTGSYVHDYELPSFEALERLQVFALGMSGKFASVLIPKKDSSVGSVSFVDWVTFTFKTSSLPLYVGDHGCITDFDYVKAFSVKLFEIFGMGVTAQRPSGMNFYEKSFEIGKNHGFVCIGGQRDSVSVTLNGQGLIASKAGWERRLFNFLRAVSTAKITRIDLASDSFESKISLDEYFQMFKAGLFNNKARQPNIEQAGNWVSPNGKGRTMYVGGRSSGKLLRIYEKGLQLANGFHEKFPNWVRVELELKAQDRIIPFDALLKPGQYLAGGYPALKWIHEKQDVVKTFKNTVQSSFERSIEITRTQFGKYINVFVEILGKDEAIERLTKGKTDLPKKLDFGTYAQMMPCDFIHSVPELVYPQGVIPL